MTDGASRAAEAERRLTELGVTARVECAGARGEVAVIRSRADLPRLLGELRERVVDECKAAGFAYVTVELD